jgi:hypothetical protein
MLKNTFEEKMYQIKIERQILLGILKSAGVKYIDGIDVETLRNVDMQQYIVNSLGQTKPSYNKSKSKTFHSKLKIATGQ